MKKLALNNVPDILTELSQTIRNWQPDRQAVERLEYEITPIDPLIWLSHLRHGQKVYWSDRERFTEVAGMGSIIVFQGRDNQQFRADMQRMESLLRSNDRVKFFGGMRFSNQKNSDPTWHAFPHYHFHLPAFEIVRENDRYVFACNLYRAPNQDLSSIRNHYLQFLRNLFPGNGRARPPLKRLGRKDNPQRLQWHEMVRTALHSLDGNPLEKVVLARKSELTFNHELKAEELLKQLRASNPNSFLFLFRPDAQNVFFGSTPERLYRRSGRQLQTEAVAGTRRRGRTAQEDQQLKNDLLHCEKDLREHAYVVRSIERVLRRHSRELQKEAQIGILENARVQHLLLRFNARLKDEVGDTEILRDLHPTPAVGGVPREQAIERILQLEKFDRGWYAGPVGWIGQKGAEFAVGIRSALLQGRTIHLFAGAGIVQGSDPELEWRELENKIANFLKILDVQ